MNTDNKALLTLCADWPQKMSITYASVNIYCHGVAVSRENLADRHAPRVELAALEPRNINSAIK